MSTLREIMNNLPEKRRNEILSRANELIQEELNLRAVRNMRNKTQEQLAVLLKKRQEEISRLEKRDDFLISTLREYIEALGGHLKAIAEFQDSPPILLKVHANNA